MKGFKKWYQDLVALSRKENLLWLISNDPEDHREGYEVGNTPQEELEEQKYSAV